MSPYIPAVGRTSSCRTYGSYRTYGTYGTYGSEGAEALTRTGSPNGLPVFYLTVRACD